MKKLILSSVVSTLISGAAMAAPVSTVAAPADGAKDSTSATLTWEADVPTIIPGAWVTFTGEGGSMTLNTADLNLQADGAFTSSPIKLELHTYDEATETAGELVKVGEDQFDGQAVQRISYTVSAPSITSKLGSDVSDVVTTVSMNDTDVGVDTNIPLNEAVTEWKVAGSNVNSMIGGDTISATTIVRADVNFAAAGGQGG